MNRRIVTRRAELNLLDIHNSHNNQFTSLIKLMVRIPCFPEVVNVFLLKRVFLRFS